MTDKDEMNQQIALAETQLRKIAGLEEKHGILGIRFSTKEGAALTLETTASYVIDAIHTAVDLVERIDEFPVEEPSEPE